jgi:hypothetical protein
MAGAAGLCLPAALLLRKLSRKMSEMVKTEIQCLASQVDNARVVDPDAARGMLWAIARRYGRAVALDVARELCQRTLTAFAEQLDRAA